MDIKIPRRKKGEHGKKVEEKYQEEVTAFVDYLKQIESTLTFKVSSRGWCYLLENQNLINKSEFAWAECKINECRKKGILPIYFVAEDEARLFDNLESDYYSTPSEFLASRLDHLRHCEQYYGGISFWESQSYYIQLVVEKIDLRTLFQNVTAKYHIPIANARGWSDISMRARMADRFKYWERKDKCPVLLYCGDHDPAGLKISDALRKNLEDIEGGTYWSPENLIIDRFGLNYDFIIKANLTWIDNLLSAKGKLPNYKNSYIQWYIANFGERKLEANALVVRPDLAEQLIEDAIQKYLGSNPFSSYNDAIKEGQDEVVELMDNLDVDSSIDDWLEQLK